MDCGCYAAAGPGGQHHTLLGACSSGEGCFSQGFDCSDASGALGHIGVVAAAVPRRAVQLALVHAAAAREITACCQCIAHARPSVQYAGLQVAPQAGRRTNTRSSICCNAGLQHARFLTQLSTASTNSWHARAGGVAASTCLRFAPNPSLLPPRIVMELRDKALQKTATA